MNEKLYELLMKLPKKNLINIMWSALDEMQAYNGRTRMYCIMESIGADITEMEDGGYKYLPPSISEIKKNTNVVF